MHSILAVVESPSLELKGEREPMYDAAPQVDKVTITIRVEGVRKDRAGELCLALFDEAGKRGYPENRAEALEWTCVGIPPAPFEWKVLVSKEKRYAVSALHDEDGNKKQSTNFVGFPKEGYAFSNSARPLLRPARFDEAAFVFSNEDAVIVLKVKYP